jgi:hypothetical protein
MTWIRPYPLSGFILAALSLPAIALANTTLQGTQPRSAVDTIVRVAEQPRYTGVATLVEELSIGVADGAEEYMLGEIADIALARDGSLYVFDRQVPAIRHYDARGKFLRTIGRRGEGPGEYRSASGLATMPDGRLLLWDTGNWRINVYSANGDVLTQWTTLSGMSGGGIAMYSRAIMVDASGLVITRKTIIDVRDIMNRPIVWLRYRPDGTPVDTVLAPPAPRAPARVTASAGRSSVSDEVPFAPRRFVVMSPLGYLIAGYPDRYAFEIHQPGKPVVSVRREVKAEPVSRAERGEARRKIEERMRQTDPTWSWNGPDIPDAKPLYADLQVALDGRIWVAITPEVSPRTGTTSGGGGVGPSGRRPPPRVESREPSRPALYDVFEPDGQYLGQVQVPARVSSVVRRGDQVWGIAFDADDVPRIKRYRIAWRR